MEKYFYEVDLTWESEKNGLINSHNLREIEIASPESPKDYKNKWTPEHLIAAALSSSYMTTFLSAAENSRLDIITYQSQCFVKLEKINGEHIPTEILLRPTIKLSSNQYMTKACKIVEEAEINCPIKNITTINISIHPEFSYLTKENGARIKS
jgi:organic hydroperoxide reductase OsmC/OhrA